MPGSICAVAICKSNSAVAKRNGQKLCFFTFPKDPHISKEWVRLCYRKDTFDPKHKRVCSQHFVSSDFEDAVRARIMNKLPTRLKLSAVPSQNLLPSETSAKEVVPVSTRAHTLKRKRQKKIFADILEPSSPPASHTSIEITETEVEDPYELLKKQCETLSKENEKLKAHLAAAENNVKMLKKKNVDLQTNLKNEREEFSRRLKLFNKKKKSV